MIKVLLLFLIALCSPSLYAHTTYQLDIEAGPAWASLNEARIPGDTGTLVDLSDYDAGPYNAYRIYFGAIYHERHEVRALYAPLSIRTAAVASSAIDFQGETFAAAVPFVARYQFNSYRLAYIYHFRPVGAWRFRLGFTNKIRDAQVSFENASVTAKKSNIGYVPLLNLGVQVDLSKQLYIDLDADALAAPQGRAEDVAIRFGYRLPRGFDIKLGYRMVEGGADNREVYTFSWFHFMTIGLQYAFSLAD